MEINGTCRACGNQFDAHWHKGVSVTKPACPRCGSTDVRVRTDETSDHRRDQKGEAE